MRMEVGGKNRTCMNPKTPLQAKGNCCRHTLVEAAEWDFKVRGKCWVLRSINQSNSVYKGVQDIYGGNHPNNVFNKVSRIMFVSKIRARNVCKLTTDIVIY